MNTIRTRVSGGAILALAISQFVTVVPEARAIDIVDGFAVNPQVRTRFVRFDGRDGDSSNGAVEYFESRVRLGVDLDMLEFVRFYVAVQDVRVWGEEANTAGDFSANGFDLNAGFADIDFGHSGATLRIGRQPIVIDGERFVGALEWAPQGRRFDAARLRWNASDIDLEVDAFYAVLTDVESILPGPATNPNTQTEHFAGLGLSYDTEFAGLGNMETSSYGFVETVEEDESYRITATVRNAGAIDIFRYRVEGWLQAGDSPQGDIFAYMFGVKAGVHLKDAAGLTVMGWFDYLSGASDPAKGARRTFDPRFGTNHKFYGLADFFLNIPAHTQGKGLMDIAAKLSIKPIPELSLAVHGHYLMTAEDQGGPSDWGTEIDFLGTWKPLKYFWVQAGVFTMLPGEALELRLGGNDPDIGVFITLGSG